MKKGLRIMCYFVGLLWLLVLFGVFMIAYCNEPGAINMIVGVAPPALVGTIACLVEWRTLRGEE